MSYATLLVHLELDRPNTGLLKIDVSLLTNPSGSQSAACRDALVLNVREERNGAGVRGSWQGEWPTAMLRPRLFWQHQMTECVGKC